MSENSWRVSFVGSFPSISKCPDSELPEFAFIGRSNVGKSSLINMICQKKNLALVSQTPGKTKLINFFEVSEGWHLVDLPGYGYARVSKKDREIFQKMIMNYLQKREQLVFTFLLIDANIPPQKIDLEFINTLGEFQIPFGIVFTKIDKSKQKEVNHNIEVFNRQLLESWEELPFQVQTSAEKNVGRQAILDYIKLWREEFEP